MLYYSARVVSEISSTPDFEASLIKSVPYIYSLFKPDIYHSTIMNETAILSHQNKEHDCRTNLYRMPSTGCLLY